MLNIESPSYPAGNFAGCASRSLNKINDLVIHHSAGPKTQTPLEINAFHKHVRGWSGVGYTWMITPDGKVHAGRPVSYVPASNLGRNSRSVSVMVIGNFEKADAGYSGPPTKAQVQALKELCVYAHEKIPTITRTYSHGDLGSIFYPKTKDEYATACCGSELKKLIPEIRQYLWDSKDDKK